VVRSNRGSRGGVVACLLALAGWAAHSQAIAGEPDAERGKIIYRKCIHCHTIAPNGKHRIGPNLFGIFGRKAGSLAGFDFSEAWKRADFVWTERTLDRYLIAPRKMIPNNRMPFDGISLGQDRADLIAYLKQATRGR
jgi:cytochrome c2